MTESELWGELTRLTNGVVHPLLGLCNRLGASQQRNVVNEIRNAAAHVEWAYRSLDVGHRERQLQSAKRHLQRAALDACKIAWRAKLAAELPTASTLALVAEHHRRVDESIAETDALEGWTQLVGGEEIDCDLRGGPWPVDLGRLGPALDAIRAVRDSDVRIVVRHHVVAADTYAEIAPWWRAVTILITNASDEAARDVATRTGSMLEAHRRFEIAEMRRLCIDLHNRGMNLGTPIWEGLDRLRASLGEGAADDLAPALDAMVAAIEHEHEDGRVAHEFAKRAIAPPDLRTSREFSTPFYDPTIERIEHGVVWFVDLAKSSDMQAAEAAVEVAALHGSFHDALAPIVAKRTMLAANTWGDGLMAAFADPADGIVALRAFVNGYIQRGTRPFRVGIECGEIRRTKNPITGQDVVGPTVVTAARLEPCANPEHGRDGRVEILCRPEVATLLAGIDPTLGFSACSRRIAKSDANLGSAGADVSLLSIAI